ncbi:hypothetical protein MLD38_039753 [Melastoma candidum]|uniref:Uncharacterized protein n=1 Tax=Melastoma candidum TaxID=119954 RepID=A0ACB9L3U6_9MYRT|nr:hypothetical protein MLD38_039753 [Melastoma candidum]
MEEPDMPWEMDEDGIEETKGRNMVCWMFHKGLVIGKKMLVMGMIISSAPVVVPPLVVISALGIAVSVPYGIILASYTCSEKLLDKLLPGTSPPFSLESGNEVKEDYGFGGGFPAEEERGKEDLSVWTETDRTNEEPGGEVIVGYRDTYKYSPTTELPVAARIEMVVLTADAPEHDHRNSEIVEASIEVEDVILMENNVGKGDNLEGVDVEEMKVLVTGVGAEGTPAESMSLNDEKLEHGVMDKTEMPVEAKGNGKKSKRKGRKKEKVEERKLMKASDETAEIKSGVAKSVSSKQEAKEDHPSQTKDGPLRFLL